MHPTTQRKPYYSNESPNVKTKAEQSFCYAPNEGSGCILSKRFSGGFLSRGWRRRKKARIIQNPGCICRFTLGFCKNKKERTETLYQSFSPFMWNDSRNDTIQGFRCAIGLSFNIGCIWVQKSVLGCKSGSVGATSGFRFAVAVVVCLWLFHVPPSIILISSLRRMPSTAAILHNFSRISYIK